MNTRLHLVVSLVVFCALMAFIGCGGEDLVLGGMPAVTPTGTVTPGCLAAGDTCAVASDCCSGVCESPDGVNLQCQ